jgi:hypothetical protein
MPHSGRKFNWWCHCGAGWGRERALKKKNRVEKERPGLVFEVLREWQ